jgi:ribosome-associated protein
MISNDSYQRRTKNVSNFDDQNTTLDSNPTKFLSSQERAWIAAQIAADNRAQNIVILDLRALTQCFDFFVIASGTSRRQMHAVSEEIDHEFEDKLGDKRLSISGYRESRWIVLDYGDIVVHLFEPETREFYALEELWGKSKVVPFVPNKGDSN